MQSDGTPDSRLQAGPPPWRTRTSSRCRERTRTARAQHMHSTSTSTCDYRRSFHRPFPIAIQRPRLPRRSVSHSHSRPPFLGGNMRCLCIIKRSCCCPRGGKRSQPGLPSALRPVPRGVELGPLCQRCIVVGGLFREQDQIERALKGNPTNPTNNTSGLQALVSTRSTWALYAEQIKRRRLVGRPYAGGETSRRNDPK